MQKSNQKTDRKSKIDFALGMAFITGNLSFNLVDSEHFRKFVNLLDPSYKVPSRQTLSTTIVNLVHSKVTSSLKLSTRSKTGTLMIDGWKNSSNNTKTVTAVVKPYFGTEIFLKSYDFSAKPEDHLNLLEIVRDASDLSKRLYDIEVESFVSDNAANMLKTGRESNLISYGCKAHTGNLYLNDVFDKLLYAEVHEIMVTFRNVQLQSCVKNEGGKSIYLAGETRWKVQLFLLFITLT